MNTESNVFKWTTDSHLNTNYNWNKNIAETRVITIKGNAHSEQQANHALRSCERVNQPNSEIFWAYDGTDRNTIRTPDHLKNNDPMSWVKVLDPALSITEVACALSHLALWIRCITINKPILILEHDAIMLRPFREITNSNSLEYLGHQFQIQSHIDKLKLASYPDLVYHYQNPANYPELKQELPLLALINYNYLYSMGLHAYAIDPFMARRLFSYVLSNGLINPIDTIVEITNYEIAQTGIYAFNSLQSETTTIGFPDSLSTLQGRKNTYSVPGVSQ
jgi:GR25 family glycosyltransferase involved in LPS biosynthesis